MGQTAHLLLPLFVLQGVIIIHEVYPDGAAAKDGRLKPGDQILEVNSEDFRNITHSKALAALRQTPAKVHTVCHQWAVVFSGQTILYLNTYCVCAGEDGGVP